MTRTGQHQRCISGIHWLAASGALALGTMCVLAALGTPPAQAQTYTVLHTFTGADGESPLGLIRDPRGDLYGVTQLGGVSGQGVVFKLDTTGETVLYSFTGGADGAYPTIGLVQDAAGNLYGTTAGGASPFGEVFKLDTTGTETVLHNFGGLRGGNPASALIRDADGNFYGTTWRGGSAGYGVVFKLDSTGAETVLYNFTGGADGGKPYAPLIRDASGNLYGTTSGGGIKPQICRLGCGVVFKLDTTGTETVLHSFTGGADGTNPSTGLIRDSAGNLYGTTPTGGESGWGIAFEVDTAGTETVLYSFTGGNDGGKPEAGLIRDLAGNLYGTAIYSESGFGVVFRIAP